MMSKCWKHRPVDEILVAENAAGTGLPLPITRVLALRGLRGPDEINEFLKPRLANLADPFVLPSMGKAVRRIWRAIETKETIAVFGDYDVDGVASAALLTRILAMLGARVEAFIPDRIDEGYGLSPDALERCIGLHAPSLLISVDCGTNSVSSVAYAQAQKVDVIVTDHHEPEEENAPAFALINPKLGKVQGHHNLSGVGVAFKLAHALVKFGRTQGIQTAEKIDLRYFLDLVALGTVADIVPLEGENRCIVRHGLAVFDSTKWVGLKALKEVAGIRGKIDTFHLGFQLGPRINAAGRIGRPMEALRLLITDDTTEARRIARLLDETNRERRRIEHEMADEAFAEIDAYFSPEKHFGLVVARQGWHPGVVGIVAARISYRYNRPAIVMGIEADGNARGSCRGIDEYNLLEGLRACAEYLTTFGGHKMAAGLEMVSESLDIFKTKFNTAVASKLGTVDLSPCRYIDAVVSAEEVNLDFLGHVKRLGPFGQNNAEPVWAMHGLHVEGIPRVVGRKHLKLTLASNDQRFDAIAFNHLPEQLPADKVDIAFTIRENHWNGGNGLQLQIQDFRPAKELEL